MRYVNPANTFLDCPLKGSGKGFKFKKNVKRLRQHAPLESILPNEYLRENYIEQNKNHTFHETCKWNHKKQFVGK